MAKLFLLLLVALPCVISSDNRARNYPPQATAVGGGGASGNQYDKGESAAETHNDKQFELKFGKQSGTSSVQSHDQGQQMGAGGFGAASAPIFPAYGSGWPSFPQGWGSGSGWPSFPHSWRPQVPHGWGGPFPPHGWGGQFPHGGGFPGFPFPAGR